MDKNRTADTTNRVRGGIAMEITSHLLNYDCTGPTGKDGRQHLGRRLHLMHPAAQSGQVAGRSRAHGRVCSPC